jgi:hypothetical protein
MEEVSEVPEVNQTILNKILKILSDYKMKIINTNTLTTQEPSELNSLNSILREKSKKIKDYILRGVIPIGNDAELANVIHLLKPLLNPWNPDTSILARYWCERIFETDNFATAEHLQRIMNDDQVDTVMPNEIEK